MTKTKADRDWQNKLKKPVIFDAKADIIIYGMGEIALEQVTRALDDKRDYTDIRGICYISKEPNHEYIQLPSHADCLGDKEKYIDLFDDFYDHNDPISARGLCQPVDTRFLLNAPCPCRHNVPVPVHHISACFSQTRPNTQWPPQLF